MVPDTEVYRVLKWAGGRVPLEILDKVRIEVDTAPTSMTIVECRPPGDAHRAGSDWMRSPIARLRYTQARRTWALYRRDRNQKFHLYELIWSGRVCLRVARRDRRRPNGDLLGVTSSH